MKVEFKANDQERFIPNYVTVSRSKAYNQHKYREIHKEKWVIPGTTFFV